jgi:polyisoprenoid-binding protein YceI
MKNFGSVIVASILVILPSLAIASMWQIDPDHSSIQFKVRHMPTVPCPTGFSIGFD